LGCSAAITGETDRIGQKRRKRKAPSWIELREETTMAQVVTPLFNFLKDIYELLQGKSVTKTEQKTSLTTDFFKFEQTKEAIVLCLYHLALYYSIAVVGLSIFAVEADRLSVVDALYYSTTIYTTVGYGDTTLGTRTGQIISLGLGVYGICILGIFLGILGNYILELNKRIEKEQQKAIQSQWIGTMQAKDSGSTLLVSKKEKSLYEEVAEIIHRESPTVFMVALFALLIGHVEGWTTFESLYWAAITGSTMALETLLRPEP
jgi:hypothetical protein